MLRFGKFCSTLEPGKDWFAVKCGDHSEPHKVSFLSPDFSVSGKMDLPFDKHANVFGGSCGGLLYFHGVKGQIVLCNPSIEERAILHLPVVRGGYDPNRDRFMSSCLGYDAKSEDFKLIRFYHDEEEDIISNKTYSADMYSFKRGTCVNIKIPPFVVDTGAGAYVRKTGSCYWVALASTLGSEEDLVEYARNSLILAGQSLKDEDIVARLGATHVLSFDCTTERFNHLPLPQEKIAIARVLLVECLDSLGALFYWYQHKREEPRCYHYDSNSDLEEVLCIQLSVWNGVSWHDKYTAYLPGARRPLGLKDDCLLFVELKKPVRDPYCSQLMVYDVRDGQKKKLNIYDRPAYMSVFSYGA